MLNKHDHHHDSIITKGSDSIRKELRYISFSFQDAHAIKTCFRFVISSSLPQIDRAEVLAKNNCRYKIFKNTLDILLLLFLFIQKHLKYNYAHPMS
jgi:hypothetical protein